MPPHPDPLKLDSAEHPALPGAEQPAAPGTQPSDPHLASFPRPQNDNGRGLHFVLDARESIVEHYAPLLAKMQMRWATVYGQDELQTTRAASYLLVNYGIFSNIHVQATGDKPKAPSFWQTLAQECVRLGIPPYIQVFNEPEQGREGFGNPQQFADRWGARAEAVVAGGGFPGLQVLSEEYLAAAAGGMSDAVKNKLYFCLHNYGANHPPSYPYPEKTVLEDDNTVLRFLAYEAWFKKHLGFVPPMIGGEGGWIYQNADDASMPPVAIDEWVEWHHEMYEWFRRGKLSNGDPLPDYLFCVCPWLLYAADRYGESWVDGLDANLKAALIDKLENDAPYLRTFGEQNEPPPSSFSPTLSIDTVTPSVLALPNPPPVTSSNRSGLCVSNTRTLQGQNDLYGIHWGSFVVLHLNKGFVPDLRAHFPQATIIMRAYTPNWYGQDPVQWAQQIAAWANELRPYTLEWTFANEQNLSGEGHPNGAPYNGKPFPPQQVYADINAWNLRVVQTLRSLAPWVRIHWPALSQGHSDDRNDAGYVGFEICRPSIEACDVLDVHTYWNIGNPDGSVDSPWYGLRYQRVRELFPNMPLYISEYGGTFPNDPRAPAEYKHWLDGLPDYISGAAAFIWDSDAANAAWRIYNQGPLVKMLASYVPPAPAPVPVPVPVPLPLTDAALARLVVDQNFPHPDIAIAIILGESGGNPGARNTEKNTPPSVDRGLWQFNSRWHPEVTDACAFEPVCATRAAFVVSKGGTDFTPWASFKAGTYKQFLPRAQAALSAIAVPQPIPPPTPPTPTPPPTFGAIVDPRITWVTIQQGTMYKVTEVWYYDNRPPDDPESEGGINIYAVVKDRAGKTLQHEAVTQAWPTGSSTHYTRNGMVSFQMSGDSSFDPAKGKAGPYILKIGDASVSGLGLPLKQHVEYLIVVEKTPTSVDKQS